MIIEVIDDQSASGTCETDPVGRQQVMPVVHFYPVEDSSRAVLEFMEQGVLVFNIAAIDFTSGHIHTHTYGIEHARFFIISDAVGSRYGSQKAYGLIR